MKIKTCRNCMNSTLNPTISIGSDGLCNICKDYQDNFDLEKLKKERYFLKSLQDKSKKYDCLIGLSGGKDSTAMLKTVLDMGFHPLAFTFQIGYNNVNERIIENLKKITHSLNVDYEVIDIHNYISLDDSKCFNLMADLYDKVDANQISDDAFLSLYNENRKHYSTKDNKEMPYIRPCQICRKVTIKAYYAEAVKRNINIIFIGINEWASKEGGNYSAIRTLKPFVDKPEVRIVHLPFLVQRKYTEVLDIIKQMGYENSVLDLNVETGGNNCLLAKACEKTAFERLHFHLDASRLSREITVGFIDKKIAIEALNRGSRLSELSVRSVLEQSGVL